MPIRSTARRQRRRLKGIRAKWLCFDRISNDPYQCTTHLVDIHKIANFEKKVPLDWVNAYHTDMCRSSCNTPVR